MTDKKRQYGEDFQLRGKAAEWRVASELAMRGHVPFFPGLDIGFDLQLQNGLRLQVKSGTLVYRHPAGVKANVGYFFNLRRGAWDNATKRYTGKKRRSYAEIADFFVLWGIEENRFFIVPTSREKTSIWFCGRETVNLSWNRSLMDKITRERCAEYEDRWDLLDVNSIKDLVDDPKVTFPRADLYQTENETK
jgi:hypothetical protein